MTFPPLEDQKFQQFVSTDAKTGRKTFSRSCSIEQGVFILVRVPIKRGKVDLSALSEADRRFVALNVTPAEDRMRGAAE